MRERRELGDSTAVPGGCTRAVQLWVGLRQDPFLFLNLNSNSVRHWGSSIKENKKNLIFFLFSWCFVNFLVYFGYLTCAVSSNLQLLIFNLLPVLATVLHFKDNWKTNSKILENHSSGLGREPVFFTGLGMTRYPILHKVNCVWKKTQSCSHHFQLEWQHSNSLKISPIRKRCLMRWDF